MKRRINRIKWVFLVVPMMLTSPAYVHTEEVKPIPDSVAKSSFIQDVLELDSLMTELNNQTDE